MTDGDVKSWLVPLAGHRFDLEDLPRWFSGQDVHVAPFEDGFALVIPATVIGMSYEPVYAFAEERLSLVNGVGRLLSPKFRAVSLTNHVKGINGDGTVCHTVVAAGTAEVRIKAHAAGVALGGEASIDPAEGLAAPLLRAAEQSDRAHDALVIAGRPDLTWSELYLLFELVEAEVGGQMIDRRWISKANAVLFSRTANSYSVLGVAGRHGKDRGDAPSKPMKYDAAVQLIRKLVLAWMESVRSTR